MASGLERQISPGGLPFSLWLNFDKPLIGLFFIWFSTLSLANGGKWKPTLKWGTWYALGAILVLLPAAFLLGFVALNLKATHFLWLWAVHNLFFVCFAEEALFRGLIQKSLILHLQRFKMGKMLGLGIAALLFGLAHFPGGLIYVGLATVAGLFYGYAFFENRQNRNEHFNPLLG